MCRVLTELAWLIVTGRLPDDDVSAVERVDERDGEDQCGKLILVKVLGGVAQASSVTPPAASAMRVPCSQSSKAARSASVNTVASRHVATRFSRVDVSPALAASLVCMSRQNRSR